MSSQYPKGSRTKCIPEVADSSRRLVGEYPLPSALSAFGLGVGLGLFLATTVLASTRRDDETLAERVSHRVLGALSGVLPDSVARRLP